MNKDKSGLGKWQKLVLQMAESSGSYHVGDLLAQYPAWPTRSAIYRAAARLARGNLQLVTYQNGIVSLNDDTPD